MAKKNFLNKLKNNETITLFKHLKNAGGEVRFIGGCVRDAILGIDFSDIDIATNLLPEEVISCLCSHGIQVIPTGIKHGTVTAIINHHPYEITTLREDIDCDGRHATVKFTGDWEIDSTRRDFTINALSLDMDGKIYDYHGGLADLDNKTVIFIGNPNNRITEDYLRILRFYRFCGKYGNCNFDQNTRSLCTKYIDKIQDISIERIYQEFEKIVKDSNFETVILAMYEDKILSCFFPDINLNLALLKTLNIVSKRLDIIPNLTLIFAALLMSTGKTKCSILLKKNDIRLLEMLLQFPFESFINIEKEIKRFHYLTGDYFIQFYLMFFTLNYTSIYNQLMEDIFKIYSKKEKNIFPITGADLLKVGYNSGIEIGQLLKKLEQAWIESNFTLSKKDLIELL